MMRRFFLISLLVFLVKISNLNPDTYIANKEISYGADNYKINYEKQIITASGHAYFKKEKKVVTAKKIVIYYAKDIAKAKFFGNVVLKDKVNNSVVKGSYGYVKYNKRIYFLSGNVNYVSQKARIFADRVFYFSQRQEYKFLGNVKFQNNSYVINSDRLLVRDDFAIFSKDVKVVKNSGNETLNCSYMKYNINSKDSFFRGDVIYRVNNETNHFIISSDAIKYVDSLNLYYLVNHVFILTENYRINADYVIYNDKNNYLKADGNVITTGKNFSIKGDSYLINNSDNEVNFYREVHGFFRLKPGY